MSIIASAPVAGDGGSPTGSRPAASPRKPGDDTAAVAAAKQAKKQAEARVDADRRAHSPDCVAVDEKGLNQAQAQLSAAQNAAQSEAQGASQSQVQSAGQDQAGGAGSSSGTLSIVV